MMCRLLRLQTELLPDVTELLAVARALPHVQTAAATSSGGGTGRGGRSRIFGAVIQTETTVFGDRGKPALALARPLPHQTFARHQKTRVNHLPDRDAPRTMRRPWRSLRQLIDILLGQIAGALSYRMPQYSTMSRTASSCRASSNAGVQSAKSFN